MATVDKRSVALYHVTPARNIDSIVRHGVQVDYSLGARQVSWWVRLGMLHWAAVHVMSKHATNLSDIVVVEATIPAYQLRRYSLDGVFYCLADVPIFRYRMLFDIIPPDRN